MRVVTEIKKMLTIVTVSDDIKKIYRYMTTKGYYEIT